MRSIWRYAEERRCSSRTATRQAELLGVRLFPAPTRALRAAVRGHAGHPDDDRYLSRDANRDAALAMGRPSCGAPWRGGRAARRAPGRRRRRRTCSGACGSVAHGATLAPARRGGSHIGHSTFVWHGDNPCGLWAEACRGIAMGRASSTPAPPERSARGRGFGGGGGPCGARPAAARCVEMLAEFPTSLERRGDAPRWRTRPGTGRRRTSAPSGLLSRWRAVW